MRGCNRRKFSFIRFSQRLSGKIKANQFTAICALCKGETAKEDRLSVAIVGARECSPYGRQLTKEFAKKLASAGAQIISGMAKGIDGAGQIGALEEGGDSYGVWGAGWTSVTLENTLSCIRSWKEKAGFYQSSPSGQSRCRSFSLPEIELSVDLQISYL